MAYLMTHFFPNGTEQQYRATIAIAHPKGALPAGQTFHAAGPTTGGWLVVALWDSKDASDNFMSGTLIPALGNTPGALQGPPQERNSDGANVITA